MNIQQLHDLLDQELRANTVDPNAQVVVSALPFEKASVVAVHYDKVSKILNIASYKPT
jgi:hypothetical protein